LSLLLNEFLSKIGASPANRLLPRLLTHKMGAPPLRIH